MSNYDQEVTPYFNVKKRSNEVTCASTALGGPGCLHASADVLDVGDCEENSPGTDLASHVQGNQWWMARPEPAGLEQRYGVLRIYLWNI